MNIINNKTLAEIESGKTFKAYYQGAEIEEFEGKLLFDAPYTGALDIECLWMPTHEHAYYPSHFETKTFSYDGADAMECDITIQYHPIKYETMSFDLSSDETLYALMVDCITITCRKGDDTITIIRTPREEEKRHPHSMFRWGCPSDSYLKQAMNESIVALDIIHDILFHHDYFRLVNNRYNIGLYLSIIDGIINSTTKEFVNELMQEYCATFKNEDGTPQSNATTRYFDKFKTIIYFIHELVNKNKPESLRLLPLEFRVLLIDWFNRNGKHEIVAALNYFHKGDYKDPGKDLML